MIKKCLKFLSLTFLAFLLFWWLVLSPVSFPNDKYFRTIISPDHKWKLVIVPVSLTTPLSFIQALQNKSYIVLFDEFDNYVGQSTPFCLMPIDDFNVLFPSKYYKDVGIQPEDCDYEIPTDDKKWWSEIIGFLHY